MSRLEEIEERLSWIGLDPRDFASYAREDLHYLLARVRALEAGLAEYADPDWWASVDEHDAGGWLFMRDRAEPWQVARAGLAGDA